MFGRTTQQVAQVNLCKAPKRSCARLLRVCPFRPLYPPRVFDLITSLRHGVCVASAACVDGVLRIYSLYPIISCLSRLQRRLGAGREWHSVLVINLSVRDFPLIASLQALRREDAVLCSLSLASVYLLLAGAQFRLSPADRT